MNGTLSFGNRDVSKLVGSHKALLYKPKIKSAFKLVQSHDLEDEKAKESDNLDLTILKLLLLYRNTQRDTLSLFVDFSHKKFETLLSNFIKAVTVPFFK